MPVFYDVFNGDADGICALQQLRLVEPRSSELVTGVKRDIGLLARIDPQSGDQITVLDISLERNRGPLEQALARGAMCRYFDHHHAGTIPVHANLKTYIDTAADVCTSVIVDRYLAGRQRIWAVVGAFGDNLAGPATTAGVALGLNDLQIAQLRALGECLNYNAYGESIDDLHYPPHELYQTLSRYEDPFQFLGGEPVFEVLRAGRADDLYLAREQPPLLVTPTCAIHALPDTGWGRRVGGSFGNELALAHPGRAHAVLNRTDGDYRVSVRSPQSNPRGADTLCRAFGGGGRLAAAGIDRLAGCDLERFIAAFESAFTPPA